MNCFFFLSLCSLTGLVCGGLAPLLHFVPGGDRALLYVNNPESLLLEDMADCAKDTDPCQSLFQMEITGANRAWWELYNNLTGSNMGFGLTMTNKHSYPVTVRVTGRSWINSWFQGSVFSDLYNNVLSESITLLPSQTTWIVRQDQAGTWNTVWSGAVDFEVLNHETLIINIFDYLDYKKVNVNAIKYDGYVLRANSGLVYKGISPYSSVRSLPLEFVFDDTVKTNTPLPVRYYPYNTKTKKFELKTVTVNEWHGNLSPGADATAIASDMVPFYTTGFGMIDPTRCCDGAGGYPNMGNWAIVYYIPGFCVNQGKTDRVLSLTLSIDDSGIAFRRLDGKWEAVQQKKQIEYLHLTCPAGKTTEFEAAWVLGGSSCGGERHGFVLI
eukprot:TRINITY_DN3220_c0_g1_i1.p1 TRINITY_DN3220_c0_g1~~TRINITY_DN3220_c0_g1_i1.p1  ORF type:complete len:384 (-),score=70.28 TRINITY_DN3220_c0_g1_i1:217-1368(-)